MVQLTEEYIRKLTAKAALIARNAGCKYRVRKQDPELALV
jgi:histone H3/H4